MRRQIKSVSVSHFKAHLSAYLRDVQQGETYVITEHRRPVAEVHKIDAAERLVAQASEPFSLKGIGTHQAIDCPPGLSRDLLNEDRGG